MTSNLQHRQLRARVGQVQSMRGIKADRQRKADFIPGQFIMQPQVIWWKTQLAACPCCGSAGHLYINRAGYGVRADDATFVCRCSQCDRLADFANAGQMLFDTVSPYRAARKAADNWNKGILPKQRNPLSMPLKKVFRDATRVF